MGRTHVSLCRSASLSLDTRSFCESLLFSPSTVSSAGRDSSKRVPVVDWIDKCMQCSLCCKSSGHRDRDPWPVQPRASACCSIRARAKNKMKNSMCPSSTSIFLLCDLLRFIFFFLETLRSVQSGRCDFRQSVRLFKFYLNSMSMLCINTNKSVFKMISFFFSGNYTA